MSNIFSSLLLVFLVPIASTNSASLYTMSRTLEVESSAPCSAEEAAYRACVTPGNAVSLRALDCAFCSAGALFKLHSFASTEEQVSIVCNALQEADYCEEEFHACVREHCPKECQETVSARTDCVLRQSGCDMRCSTSLGFKTKGAASVFALCAVVALINNA